MSKVDDDNEGGKGLPIIAAIVVVGIIVFAVTRDCGGSYPCKDSAPAESGYCPDKRQIIQVESGAIICRCKK